MNKTPSIKPCTPQTPKTHQGSSARRAGSCTWAQQVVLTVASIATHDRLDGRNGILGFIIVVGGVGFQKGFALTGLMIA